MSAILSASRAIATTGTASAPAAQQRAAGPEGRLGSLRLPFRDLSYRFKIPFSVSVVILVTALIVSAVLIVRSYQYLRQDLVTGAESLGKTLSRALLPVMLHDEIWQAYEIVITPFDKPGDLDQKQKVILVLDPLQQVYVSSHPSWFRTFEPLAAVSASHKALSEVVASSRATEPFVIEGVVPDHIVVAVPILSEDGSRLGMLLLQYAESLFLPRFWATVRQVLLSTAMVLAILIPIGWFAGNRMAIPLLSLAGAMRRVGSEPPSKIRAELYLGGDEIGQLGRAFRGMVKELEEKQALERQMIMSDRLASIGRLTAGIAHEINNPLGGMFNAINTFKHHGSDDPLTARTISLLERGLTQIKETVGALLVEARIEAHALTHEDLEDVRTLVAPQAAGKRLEIQWHNGIRGGVPLPSTPVRQVLINLLLNAVQAAHERGHVSCRVDSDDTHLTVRVENDGLALSARQREHLFEPFVGDAGGGLGLWVTYQIVQQLKGEVGVDHDQRLTCFHVKLPIGGHG